MGNVAKIRLIIVNSHVFKIQINTGSANVLKLIGAKLALNVPRDIFLLPITVVHVSRSQLINVN